MRSSKPSLQFSLLHLFGWVLAVSLLFGAARLPWPVNGYVAPLYAAFLAGAMFSRSAWWAAICGGLACAITGYLTAWSHYRNAPEFLAPNPHLVLAVCCCSPMGASFGLIAGLAMRELRNRRRFRDRLTSVANTSQGDRTSLPGGDE